MGLEIDRTEFTAAEVRRFENRLAVSLEVLAELLARPGFGRGEASIGAELEVSLVDGRGRPLPLNGDVLAESVDSRLTVELDRFNLESNLRHGPLAGRPFAALEAEILDALAEMSRAAGVHDADVAMVGILPTLRPADLERGAMTESPRFRALSASLRRLRQEPFQLRIHGEESLELACQDVTYEGAGTSFQVHLRVDPDAFAHVYNGIQLATPLVLALSGNSPTFLGRKLWAETRVALFKQAVDHRQPGNRARELARVSFGEGWIRGPLELFRENVAHHAVLLPVLDSEDPRDATASRNVPALRELRLHQGTVWRWNRAIYDPADDGHLRVEMRVLPSGPTARDMLASAAFHVGLALACSGDGDDWIRRVPFEEIHRDFYAAARDGIDARLHWPRESGELRETDAAELALELLPLAQSGLDRAGVDREDSEPLLAILEARARARRTGAVWQRQALEALEHRSSRDDAIAGVFAGYRELSRAGEPVHTWAPLS